jgi:hypothetical protein
MKILILSPLAPPTEGIANHSRSIATELRAKSQCIHSNSATPPTS